MMRLGHALIAAVAPHGCGSRICAKAIACEMKIVGGAGKANPHMAPDAHTAVRTFDQGEIRPVGRATIGGETH